jgi:hypothetical protein
MKYGVEGGVMPGLLALYAETSSSILLLKQGHLVIVLPFEA